tara:strand:- start:5556 stop:6434 length:879 start_codon:yes stop_codon:yes gene_type:complete
MVFSLFGNLQENISFILVMKLSLINAIQILFYIPFFILILSFLLMINYFKSGNELLIIKQYFKFKYVIIIFLPIAFFFTFIEHNKSFITEKIENKKFTILNSNKNFENKILIDNNNDIKTYTVLKNIKSNPKKIDQFYTYKSNKFEIISGKFSEDILITDDNIFSSQTTIYDKNNLIIDKDKMKLFLKFSEIIEKENFLQRSYKFKNKIFDYENVIYLIKNFLFYMIIILIFFKKDFFIIRNNFSYIQIFILFFIFYFLLNESIHLNIFNFQFQLISILILILLFLKLFKHE